MRIDPAGWPFVGGAVALAVAAGFFVSTVVGVVLLVVAGFLLFFFRDPDRVVTEAPGAVLAPADGRVLVAGTSTVHAFPADRWQQIGIFLSPLDVHVNRMPVAGRVAKVRYHPGRFLPAYRRDAGDLNEYTEVWIDHGGQPVVVRQIVGVLARRIVCRTREGADVAAGERFGVMKFGSRMDVFVPAGARITVQVGDHVVAAVTVVAVLTG
ncbi:MAG: phosphatidylserine decarboxylase family protein [Acidobacteria bacterium]|nr:phosphatidylserine decarboxylase family protein [Acidobacteriota bacterium]